MRVWGVVALAAAMASSAAAAPTGELRQAIVDYGAEVGAASYLFGACEAHIPKGHADDMVATLTGANTEDALDREIYSVWSRLYGQGRKDARKLNYDVEQCTKLIRDGTAKMTAAKAKVDRLLPAKVD